MFKKFLLFLVITGPLLFALFVGYPIKKQIFNDQFSIFNSFNYSRRCFKVGELNQFVNCLKTRPSLNGSMLIETINNETAALYPGFNVLFFVVLITQLVVLFLLI